MVNSKEYQSLLKHVNNLLTLQLVIKYLATNLKLKELIAKATSYICLQLLISNSKIR